MTERTSKLCPVRAGIGLLWLVTLAACTGIPPGVEPVSGFDTDRYLGTWYEIARLDHAFERDLDRVSATYGLRDDGGLSVLNRGHGPEGRKEAEGRAYFVLGPDRGYLKVSFFGPFYGSYVIFELGEHYEYAFVCGYSTDYLWLLSRTPTVSDDLKRRFEARAAGLGFETRNLIYPEQDPIAQPTVTDSPQPL